MLARYFQPFLCPQRTAALHISHLAYRHSLTEFKHMQHLKFMTNSFDAPTLKMLIQIDTVQVSNIFLSQILEFCFKEQHFFHIKS